MTAQLVWKAEDVIRAVGGQYLHEQTWEAHGISIDSRTVKPGDIFIALIGPTNDGHDCVGSAFAAGAVAAIVSRQSPQTPKDAPLIAVEDTQTALEFLGHAGRERAKAKIVAVTGSVGKTTSKEMLRLMLGAVGETYANEGSLNNHWGVPLSLARLPQNAEYGVFEIGMNHAGEMAALSRQARPNVAFITTVEAVHLEFFDWIESIADAKAEIFYGMNAEGTAVLNQSNSQYDRLFALAIGQGLKHVLAFGHSDRADARMLEYRPTSGGSTVKADILGDIINYHVPVPGEHMAMNSLGTLLTAVAAGGDIEACAAALQNFTQPKGRGVIQTISSLKGDFTLVDESYNASPVAVRAAIRVLSQMPAKGHRILALGDMKELGNSSPELHAGLAKDITGAEIDLVFCCGEMMSHLYGILPAALRGAWAKDSKELAPQVAEALKGGDIVTVKGSLSMQMIQVVEALKALGKVAKTA